MANAPNDYQEDNSAGRVGSARWRASVGVFASMVLSTGVGLMARDWMVGLSLFGGLLFVVSVITPRD